MLLIILLISTIKGSSWTVRLDGQLILLIVKDPGYMCVFECMYVRTYEYVYSCVRTINDWEIVAYESICVCVDNYVSLGIGV